jgi:hypothetical protein
MSILVAGKGRCPTKNRLLTRQYQAQKTGLFIGLTYAQVKSINRPVFL